jgi:hypothetical protein
MTVETLFDVIQTPVVGAIAAFFAYRQQRKTQPETALKYALMVGVGAAIVYAALEYVF